MSSEFEVHNMHEISTDVIWDRVLEVDRINGERYNRMVESLHHIDNELTKTNGLLEQNISLMTHRLDAVEALAKESNNCSKKNSETISKWKNIGIGAWLVLASIISVITYVISIGRL